MAENNYFGGVCPVGMVQIEFVGCSPSDKISEYGWKPTERAFLEVYVDGRRFRIDIGTFHDGRGLRRGLHVVGPIDMKVEQTALNAGSLFFETPKMTL